MWKILSKGLFVLYLMVLTWLVLFKLKFNILSVFNDLHRSINLVPFASSSIVDGPMNYGEMIMNCLFFIPFGFLLNVNFKQIGFWAKLVFILFYSFTAELIQYIFAIGVTDITDLITNTSGGFLGLTLYNLISRYINIEKLDRSIISMGTVLLVLFMTMRVSHIVLR